MEVRKCVNMCTWLPCHPCVYTACIHVSTYTSPSSHCWSHLIPCWPGHGFRTQHSRINKTLQTQVSIPDFHVFVAVGARWPHDTMAG